MSASKIITTIGITLLVIYCLTKVLDFYGIGISSYGSYLTFYLFLLLCTLVLPTQYPNLLRV